MPIEPQRRPSHAAKRRAWRRELLAEEIRGVLRPGITDPVAEWAYDGYVA